MKPSEKPALTPTAPGTGRRRRPMLALAVLLAAVLAFGAAACSDDSDSSSGSSTSAPTTAPAGDDQIRIGALLSVTGPGSTLGTTSEAALELSVARWNDELDAAGDDRRVVLEVFDTELDPDLAVEGLEELADWGAQVVIGPQSSSEVAAVEDLASERGVLVVSQGSTASSLAADDNVFRFVPNDRVEGRAITDLMIAEGATGIVPVWREDRGNQGLADSVRASATASGLYVAEGVSYAPDASNWTEILAELDAQKAAAAQETDAAGLVVYLAGFEEVADLLAAADGTTTTEGARWYGGDGSAQASALIDTPGSAATAIAVGGYPNPLVALPADRSAADEALMEQIAEVSGTEPDAFALAAVDAFDVAVEAIIEAGVGADVSALRAAFVSVADGFQGVTGTIELGPDGDRVSAPYAFWSICAASGTDGAWVRTGSWEPAADPSQPGTLTSGSCAQPVG